MDDKKVNKLEKLLKLIDNDYNSIVENRALKNIFWEIAELLKITNETTQTNTTQESPIMNKKLTKALDTLEVLFRASNCVKEDSAAQYLIETNVIEVINEFLKPLSANPLEDLYLPRHPEKRIFYIDTNLVPKTFAEEYVQKAIRYYKDNIENSENRSGFMSTLWKPRPKETPVNSESSNYTDEGYASGGDDFTINFGDAIKELKDGYQVYRKGWNGKDMYLQLVPKETKELSLTKSPYIQLKTADGDLVPWLASQTDVLAEDYKIIPKQAI